MKKIAVCLAILALTGCSSQVLIPAENHMESGVVCITPDDSNRKVAYNCTIQALKLKGYTVKEVPYGFEEGCDAILNCQTVSRWDLANFTSTIKYDWREDGKQLGRCHYHHRGGLAFNKFINTQEKVYDLLNKMLPKSRYLETRYTNQPTNY